MKNSFLLNIFKLTVEVFWDIITPDNSGSRNLLKLELSTRNLAFNHHPFYNKRVHDLVVSSTGL
jgi:hypothetical protein